MHLYWRPEYTNAVNMLLQYLDYMLLQYLGYMLLEYLNYMLLKYLDYMLLSKADGVYYNPEMLFVMFS